MLKHLVLIVGLIGCGGGGGVSVEDLPDEIEGADCDRAVACEGVVDRATCEGSIDQSNGFGAIEAGVKDGTIKYDSGKAGDCADSRGGTSCTFPGFHSDNPCADVFTGTVPTGGSCVIDLQCANFGECVATSPSCDPEIMCCVGTCMGSVAESPIGGPCANDLNFCVENSYCKQGTGTGPGTCTALVAAEGAACDEIDACVNPFYCNLNFQTNTGTCKKPAASGAACSRMDLLPCADSRDYCDATTLTCVKDVAVGGTCGAGIQCVGYATCIAGTCVADIAAGGACQVDAGGQCAGDLDCVGGKCTLPLPGMVCTLPPS